MKRILVLLIIAGLTACGTVGEVTTRQEDGKFKASKEAEVVISKPFDLDSHKSLLVVPNGKYMLGMSENIGYFDKVMKFEDFEMAIIKDNKQEEVGPLSGKIGLSNAYRKYKPYLYIRFARNKDKANYLQLKLINPNTAEELFVAETYMDYIWVGVNDRNTFNPLFNAFVNYIKENSKTFKD